MRLVREADNSYDPRAVKVVRTNGEQIGYLPAHIVGNDQSIGWCVADSLDAGVRYWARIAKITGGTGDKDLGVNIDLAFWDGPEEPDGVPWVDVPARISATTPIGCGCMIAGAGLLILAVLISLL